jgi:hypothetical protein
VELYIVEIQTGNQIKSENQMTLICNASNFNVPLQTIDTITFFGPNKLMQVCPNSRAIPEKNFPDGTIIRTGQICSLKILKPSLTYGGVYYCQVRPIQEACFDYTSSQVEVGLLLTTPTNDTSISTNHGTPAALISVSSICAVALLTVVVLVILLAVLKCRQYKEGPHVQGMIVVLPYIEINVHRSVLCILITEREPIMHPRQVYTQSRT